MKNWADLKKNFSSLRWQITIGSWLVLIPCFAISNIIIFNTGKASIERNISNRIQIHSELLNFSVQQWQRNSEDLLIFVSKLPRIELAAATLNGSYSSPVFKELTFISKNKLWVLRSDNGDIIDYTGNIIDYTGNIIDYTGNIIDYVTSGLKLERQQKINKINIIKKRYLNFKKSTFMNINCVQSTQPILSRSNSNKIIGSISYCLDEKLVAVDSGLDTLFQTLNNQTIQTIFSNPSSLAKFYEWFFAIEYNKLRYVTDFAIISKAGHIIFPNKKGLLFNKLKTSNSLLPTTGTKSNDLKALVDFALGPDGRFGKIKIQGTEYYVHNSSVNDIWESITLVDFDVFTKGLWLILFKLILLQIFTMLIIGFCLNLQARQISEPIALAGLNIKKISNGIFDINITHNRHDEIGELYNDINLTAGQLREFITKIAANAITKQQLDIAAKIQQDFLLDDLPQSNFYELAAIFDPAYEIGADWYDAVSLNDKIYIVIADVCDKGIASALFMSVFRTLMRYTLLKYHSVLNSTCEEILADIILSVNHYMATTHKNAMMFATVFIASYSYKNNLLSYVCAGHESPILIRSDGIETLKSTGPAIGIFQEAKFEVNQIKFQPGDVVFAYTDGLTDARSPTNSSWGIKNLKDAISAERHNNCSAKELLTNITNKAIKHIDTAEQFDDLTILVLKAKDGK